MSIKGFGRNFLYTNGRMFGRATKQEALMRKAAAEGQRVLLVTPEGWFEVDADGNRTPVEPPRDPMKYVSEGGRIETPNFVMYKPVYATPDSAEVVGPDLNGLSGHSQWSKPYKPSLGRNWYRPRFMEWDKAFLSGDAVNMKDFAQEGDAPVEVPEGKSVAIYILLFRDDSYPQHTHYISPHGSLGEAKAAVRKTKFTSKIWKANSDKEWHLTDSAHEGVWIIRESHVRITGEG